MVSSLPKPSLQMRYSWFLASSRSRSSLRAKSVSVMTSSRPPCPAETRLGKVGLKGAETVAPLALTITIVPAFCVTSMRPSGKNASAQGWSNPAATVTTPAASMRTSEVPIARNISPFQLQPPRSTPGTPCSPKSRAINGDAIAAGGGTRGTIRVDLARQQAAAAQEAEHAHAADE